MLIFLNICLDFLQIGINKTKLHPYWGGRMAGPNSKEEVLEAVKTHNVQLIQLWFCDILGVTKSVAITPAELPEAIDYGKNFDGSSIEGYRDIEESDMVAMPDISTFQLLPFTNDSKETIARIICDIKTPQGTPYEGDPRGVLRRIIEKAQAMGFTSYMGPELEYFYFKSDTSTEFVDHGGYFFLNPSGFGQSLRQQTVAALEAMGVAVETEHHEVAPSQHEIDLKYDQVLAMADKTITYKMVVKEIARRNGVYASFMPKPVFGINGSGMHVHQSLFTGSKNMFFDAKDKNFFSQVGKSYIAGLMMHAREFCSVTNPSINSYKRLVPGYEAPVYIAWSRSNRSAMIRIPDIRPGHDKSTRLELRSPDPSGNPYLQFAVMLAAGLKGVAGAYPLPASVDTNLYKLSAAERKEYNILTLPGSLGDAIELTAQSTLIRETLGEHMFNRYLDIKRGEWDKYSIRVSDYEIQKLLPIL